MYSAGLSFALLLLFLLLLFLANYSEYCIIVQFHHAFSILHHALLLVYTLALHCLAALPGSLARQPCPAALPGSLARQPCLAALIAWQPCPAAMIAWQPCSNITSLITGRRPACSIAYLCLPALVQVFPCNKQDIECDFEPCVQIDT
jgi:hypothetical protein